MNGLRVSFSMVIAVALAYCVVVCEVWRELDESATVHVMLAK